MCRYNESIAHAVISRCGQRDVLVEYAGIQFGEQGGLTIGQGYFHRNKFNNEALSGGHRSRVVYGSIGGT